MKTGRTRTLLIVLTLIVILAGCGKDNSQATEVPADLVSEIAGEISSEAETMARMRLFRIISRVLLDGCVRYGCGVLSCGHYR